MHRFVEKFAFGQDWEAKRRALTLVILFVSLSWQGVGYAEGIKKLEIGRLESGATVSFVRSSAGEWGIKVAGGDAPVIEQAQPAGVEVYRQSDDIRKLSAGYKTVKKIEKGADAYAEVQYGPHVLFRMHDVWHLKGSVLSVRRTVRVVGNAEGGFDSEITFDMDRSTGWTDVNYMVPGAIYGDPTYDGDRSPGGTLNYAARRLVMREDILAAPLFALSFRNGSSISLLDPAPRGDSTEEETKLTNLVMIDARFQFGAMGAWQGEEGAIHVGFLFPGTIHEFSGPRNKPAVPRWVRRYHPISQSLSQNYQVDFRFGHNESFPEVTRDSWRWAWNTLNPPVNYINVDETRRVLIDHLAAHVETINGRTGVPFVLSTMNDKKNWNWPMVALGFVGKDIECADQLLREGDRDKTERGQKMRQLGLGIITTTIQALPTVPLQATGFDIQNGKPWDHIWLAPWLRNATEDMRVLMRAYRRERLQGRQHPEWMTWAKNYVDWLIQQQREDGSFPRRWKPGSNEVAEPTGTASYNPVPLLVLMTEETGDPKYQQAAIRAAEYVWTAFGSRGLFVGGASDNPNITDKEAGMLSMEAFLSLYESTKDPKWLERAQTAGDFAESWIWIWNLPMAVDADNAQLHWKKGVPTVGLQGITALNTGSTDEYLSWAVPSYAKLYNYTGDEHYLQVARVLLNDTKSMVALPGRQYDMKGIGWQQENFRLGPGPNGRGVGSHRFWLPWVSANHLYGITGLEEYDPALFKRISTKPAEGKMAAAK
jgi:hypothetical protein